MATITYFPPAGSSQAVGTFDVSSFGAKGDAQQTTDGVVTITSGVTHVSSASMTFTSADVGKTIWAVKPSAPDGSVGYVPQTAIASIVSAHEVTVTGTSNVAGTGCYVVWGTNDTPAFVSAFNAATATGLLIKNTITIPGGRFYIITDRWYYYPTQGYSGPNVLGGDDVAWLMISPNIPVPGDSSGVMIHSLSPQTVFKNLYCKGSGINVPFNAGQAFIQITLSPYIRMEYVTVNNIEGTQNSFDIAFTACQYLYARGISASHSNGYSAAGKRTVPFLFDQTVGNVYEMSTSNMFLGVWISHTPPRDGLGGNQALNFYNIFCDEVNVAADANVYMRDGGVASFFGGLIWGRSDSDSWALYLQGNSKAYLWGNNLGPYTEQSDSTAMAVFIQAGSKVYAQGNTLRCSSPSSGPKRVIDNYGDFWDLGGNEYLWGNNAVGGPSIPIAPTSTSSVAAQAFLNPPLVNGADFSAVHVGRNGAGAITLTGAQLGQRVRQVTTITAGAIVDSGALFETTITVAGQIQQISASDLSAVTYAFLLQTGI